MKRFLRTLTSGRLWVHLVLIAMTMAIILAVTLWWMRAYTRHGESLSVPNLHGLTMKEVEGVLQNIDLTYEVTDSIYSDEYPRGSVVIQNPEANQLVKEGRTIFLSVNSILPEVVSVPVLLGKSLRIAKPLLDITGLKIESLKYVADESCTDCVVGLMYEGKELKGGEKLRKGEKITLVLGRQSNEETLTPNILGLDYTTALVVIQASSLNAGQIISCSGCATGQDTARAYVVNQIPERNAAVALGSYVDVFLSTDPGVARAFNQSEDSLNYEMD